MGRERGRENIYLKDERLKERRWGGEAEGGKRGWESGGQAERRVRRELGGKRRFTVGGGHGGTSMLKTSNMTRAVKYG